MHFWKQSGLWLKQYVPCAAPPKAATDAYGCIYEGNRKGACGAGVLICQVGLVKSSTGREKGMEEACLDLFQT